MRHAQPMRGVYTLYLHLPAETTLTVGALGRRRFEPGVYCYVGSAQNSVKNRLRRHLTGAGATHWHIDYLRAHAEPVGWQALKGNTGYECVLAAFLKQHSEGVDGFGCSDCGCGSHLFWLAPERCWSTRSEVGRYRSHRLMVVGGHPCTGPENHR